MKQRITIDDLNMLTEAQKQALREWWRPQFGDVFYFPNEKEPEMHTMDRTWILVFGRNDLEAYPLLSVGQMIELLSSKVEYLTMQHYGSGYTVVYEKYDMLKEDFHYDNPELCDALFEAVKQVLGG
jgi:hypothetical protein